MSRTKQKGPQVEVETYRNAKAFEKDAEKRLAAGWELTSQSGLDQDIAKFRTAGKILLTGGLGLAIGGRSKKGDVLTATWTKPVS
jgi:hypothetical protein